jgi:hypothetical protein
LLLNNNELNSLIDLSQESSPRREWLPYPPLHRGYVETVREVRHELSVTVADEWARKCVRFGRRLEKQPLWLSDGIEIVREWVWELRRLLRAMGATQLLPRPEGSSPTPATRNDAQGDATLRTDHGHAGGVELLQTTAVKQAAAAAVAPQVSDRHAEDVERMLTRIRNTPDGVDDKPAVLIKAEHISNKRGRAALRVLEQLGEYDGFARQPPYRQPPSHA